MYKSFPLNNANSKTEAKEEENNSRYADWTNPLCPPVLLDFMWHR